MEEIYHEEFISIPNFQYNIFSTSPKKVVCFRSAFIMLWHILLGDV